MQQNYPKLLSFWAKFSGISLVLLLVACGGGSGSSGGGAAAKRSSSSSSLASEDASPGSSSESRSASSSSSGVSDSLSLSGIVTYDFVPFNDLTTGLDYLATERRPVRGAVVELLSENNIVLATTSTDASGAYQLPVTADTLVKVRVKAQLLRAQTPRWDMSVRDNTQSNQMYVLDGSLVSSGASDSQRNLHAASGWGGSRYTAPRAAGPFAILDAVYIGLQRVLAAGANADFPALQLRWSPKNMTAANPDKDFSTGEIGTTSFTGPAIYVLGKEDDDTDEYDTHVILHEWGHYLEAALSRLDSIGGQHGSGDYLDMRVALSEGFGNAFSAMMLNDVYYRDSYGSEQAYDSIYDISAATPANAGWFSEASIGALLYRYYHSGNNKIADDFSPILTVLTDPSYRSSDALTSIFLFSERLLTLFPQHTNVFVSLLEEQDIHSVSRFGEEETNDGGVPAVLPIYKTMAPGDVLSNVCSSSKKGRDNKLGVSQFIHLTVPQGGKYQIRVSHNDMSVVPADPGFVVYWRGFAVAASVAAASRVEEQSGELSAGSYVLEVFDSNKVDEDATTSVVNSCFDVQVNAI